MCPSNVIIYLNQSVLCIKKRDPAMCVHDKKRTEKTTPKSDKPDTVNAVASLDLPVLCDPEAPAVWDPETEPEAADPVGDAWTVERAA